MSFPQGPYSRESFAPGQPSQGTFATQNPYALPPPPPPRRRMAGWKLALILTTTVGGLALLGCCGIGSLLYVVNIREIEEQVTEADQELVITAEELAARAPGTPVDPTLGKLRKVRHLDGSREVEYEYQSPDSAASTLFVCYQAGFETTTDDAGWAYRGLGIGVNIGLARGGGGDVKQVERNDLWRYGDESSCIILTNKHGNVGNLFMARKGKKLFMLMFVGIYFEDPAAIEELLGPMQQQLESYEGT